MGIQGKCTYNLKPILVEVGNSILHFYFSCFLNKNKMTQRLDLYSDSLSRAIQPEFKPQVVRET